MGKTAKEGCDSIHKKVQTQVYREKDSIFTCHISSSQLHTQLLISVPVLAKKALCQDTQHEVPRAPSNRKDADTFGKSGFLMTEKAKRRVPEENPIQALKCHMQDAGVGTLKGEDS